MNFHEISSEAVSILTPLFVLGVEQYAKEFGKEELVQTENLKSWLWNKFAISGDNTIIQTSNLYETNPQSFKDPMIDMLSIYLRNHLGQATELANRMNVIESNNKDYNITINTKDVDGVLIVGDHNKVNQKR